jgi:hypothetical protein
LATFNINKKFNSDSCVPLNKFHATYFSEVGGHHQAWKVSGHDYVCWKIGFASFYYDFLVYEVDLVRSCISGIIDWLGLWGLTPLSTIF